MSTTSTVVGPPVQHEVRGEVLALTLDVEAGRTSFHHGISGDPHVQELNVATNRDHSRRLSPYHPDCTRIKLFVINNFLPLGFLVALVFALSWPQPGQEVASWKIGSIRAIQALNNICVFFISGLTLKSNDLKQALKHWVGIVYCLIAIMLATPCAGFITQHIPFRPREFIEGLTIFCAVPTTLGVGVALVGASNGNQTLALFLTVATNILGIVTVPYVLKLLLLGSSTISINALDLFVKLVITVLVPTLIGKVGSSSIFLDFQSVFPFSLDIAYTTHFSLYCLALACSGQVSCNGRQAHGHSTCLQALFRIRSCTLVRHSFPVIKGPRTQLYRCPCSS
eukprot:TRINITY_DN1508_c0_g1_i1.p1 TRINITY_DN1508_c0_g1~~TRINITY_DN1508_c0_g1_i1.p1  ORF type:complete len:339 (+),score=-15.46 TRINITY_DN1508_c0_g1_i1:100-1116(+)